jgi:hypothetical protein
VFRHHTQWTLAVVALLGMAVACKKKTPPPPAEAPAAVPLSVSAVTLGKQIGADKMVVQPVATFGTKDTVYASVATVGASSDALLSATWTFQTGQLVKADSQRIAPTGPAITEFHISKPSGWPVGKYHVAIMLNGAQAGAGDFEVKR